MYLHSKMQWHCWVQPTTAFRIYFAPMDKKGATLDPICLLMIEKQNSLVEFANIYCNGNFGMTSYLGIPVN